MNKPPTQAQRLPQLPERRPDSHKGDFGRALLVGGSRGMAGALGLAGMSALRGGAGLVTLAVPEPILDVVATYEPSYMTTPLPADGEGRVSKGSRERIRDLAANATCIGCGPGIGRAAGVTELVTWMFAELSPPMVVDADALFALAEVPGSLEKRGGPRVLTPHPGEFRRLAGKSGQTREVMEKQAIELAAAHDLVIVLKGSKTLITDGTRSHHNTTGNPGMATGGSGDVLTGLLTALICQGLSPWEAAILGVHVHGKAGDLAAAELGQVGMIASDLLRFLPIALKTST